MILKYSGFDMLTAIDGFDGLKLAESEVPNLILLDLMMPGINGWDVLAKLKENPVTASIPVIIFTAKEYTTEETQEYSSKVNDFIQKPFTPAHLIEIIKKHIQKSDS